MRSDPQSTRWPVTNVADCYRSELPLCSLDSRLHFGQSGRMAVSLLSESDELFSPPIYADLNSPTPWLTSSQTTTDLATHGFALVEGVTLLLFDDDAQDDKLDDLIAIGVARFDGVHERWVADISRGAYVHFSDVDEATQERWLRFRPENGQPYRP